jgi:hypothetical protein
LAAEGTYKLLGEIPRTIMTESVNVERRTVFLGRCIPAMIRAALLRAVADGRVIRIVRAKLCHIYTTGIMTTSLSLSLLDRLTDGQRGNHYFVCMILTGVGSRLQT